MFLAHLPAGYITARMLQRLAVHERSPWFTSAAMLGAIAPDFDLVALHLLAHPQQNHHLYPTHWPSVWLALLLASLILGATRAGRHCAELAAVFCLSGLIHLLLDSIVGRIYWLAPWSDQRFGLFTVPAIHHPWWLNFIFHWSALLELAIILLAAWLWRREHLASAA